MSRSTSVYGLSPTAQRFLDEHVLRSEIKVCPTCGHKEGGKMISKVYDDKAGVAAGMFDDGPELYEYETKDGKVWEVVQEVPWSSGPCIFLCLQDKDKKKIGEWSRKEIDGYL